MAEGLLPHHHIIRRAGPAINKYLNLSDEGLVGRLIASGCISEKDKDKYTGKTKRVRDRFIARFQNQPYELFLTFVECLRRDEKYVKLVTILDEALAEYGYVPPATSASESREKDTIHLQSEDVPSLSEQERSPTTTGDLTGVPPSDVTTIPSDVGKENVILTTTSLSKTTSLPSAVAMEESSSSDALQQGVATEKADSVTMESLDVTKEVVGNVTEEASDSKLKLQRQYAVSTEDDKLPTPLPIVSGQPLENVDSITTSFNGLSIATKEGDFPRLPFEGDRETMTFTSEGGELFSFVHKFRIVVPPNAVPPGNYATLHVTGYSHGPFKLPNSCKPCSDFIFVEMEGIDSFQLPVMVEISHNLIMESYTRCREVSICRCEYDGTIIALDPSHQYPIIFQKITEPEVSDNDNVFSFSLTTFCGLCAVYDVCESYKFPYLKSKTNSSDHHPLHHSQSGEYPSHHSQSGEYLLHHNHSISTDSRAPSFNSQSSCGSVECKDSPIRGGSRKRKMEESYSAGSQEKQICQLTYVLLCYWPVAYKNEVISVIIFVCRNCPTSIAACKNLVAKLSGFKTDPSKSVESLEFRFDESRRIAVDVEVTTANAAGWDIHCNTNEIHENEVWRDDDQRELLKHKFKDFQYPPKIILNVSYDKENAVSRMIKFTLHCSGIQETVYSKNCDKKINLQAKSSWFNNNIDLINTSSWSMSSVDFDFSPHVITTKILVQVAMVMTQFEFVARNLGFDENHIIRLQEDYGNRDEQCYQMLRKWWESSPKQLPATLEELHEALCFNKQENCLPEVLENSNNYESVEWLSSTTGISEKMLSSNTLQDSDDTAVLCEVATKVTGKWRQVGRLVGLDDTEIDEIHYDYQKVREKAYQMLRKWREKSGSSAVLSHLAIALLIVNQPKAIDFLKR